MGRLTLFISISIFSVSSFAAPKKVSLPDHRTALWGTDFKWISPSSSTKKQIEQSLADLKRNSRAYDPDCLWSKDSKDKCEKSPLPKVTAELDSLAESFKAETDGAFNVIIEKEGKKYRDYGGLVQGYVLDKFRKISGDWSANFAGDIFVDKKLSGARSLTIEDPEVEGLRLADVKMNSGWMFGSDSPKLGSKIADPKTGKPAESEFHKIVLFAKPEFSGARLDAWSTSLIVGGKSLLKKLRDMKQFKGQWEYFYVDSRNQFICSKNLKCKLIGGDKTVVLPW